jgi:hypothetical protein
MDIWNHQFIESHPIFEPLAGYETQLGSEDWPRLPCLQQLLTAAGIKNAAGLPLRLISQELDGTNHISHNIAHDHDMLSYEQRLYVYGELLFRANNWHDLLNVLTWLRFPHAKAALNARHYWAMIWYAEQSPARSQRGRVRDTLTLFDESGVVVWSADASLLDQIRYFQWIELFWMHRQQTMNELQLMAFGHALYEKALAPYVGMTGHSRLIQVSPAFMCLPLARQRAQIAVVLAAQLRNQQLWRHPYELAPLPVLGLPGWWDGNNNLHFYQDTRYFRPGRRSVATNHLATI